MNAQGIDKEKAKIDASESSFIKSLIGFISWKD